MGKVVRDAHCSLLQLSNVGSSTAPFMGWHHHDAFGMTLGGGLLPTPIHVSKAVEVPIPCKLPIWQGLQRWTHGKGKLKSLPLPEAAHFHFALGPTN